MKPKNVAISAKTIPSTSPVELKGIIEGGSSMSAIFTQDDRMVALLADAMDLPEDQRAELSRWLSGLVQIGVSLDPESVRAAGADGIRALLPSVA